jgi:hypothetical protein
MDFGQNCFGKESDGASGVNVGHIQGEEFAAEDCHLPNVLHHVSSFQLHLKANASTSNVVTLWRGNPNAW